jgi:hypothetical protein
MPLEFDMEHSSAALVALALIFIAKDGTQKAP